MCVPANSVKKGPGWQLGGRLPPLPPPVAPALVNAAHFRYILGPTQEMEFMGPEGKVPPGPPVSPAMMLSTGFDVHRRRLHIS